MNESDLDVIVRFHDPRRFFELRRAMLALVCQNYQPIKITLVTQRFSTAQIDQLYIDLKPTLALGEKVDLAIENYAKAQPVDARSALLNLGIQKTTGRYLAFLDHDDSIFANAYCDLIHELSRSNAAIAFGSIAMKDAEVFAETLLVERRRAAFKGANLTDLFAANFCPIHSFVVNRQKVDANDLWFDESLSMLEDYDFLLRICAKYQSSFKLIGQVVGDYYLKSDDSNTLPSALILGRHVNAKYMNIEEEIGRRKQEYLISEVVQRMLGIVPISGQMTIDGLFSRVARPAGVPSL